MLNLKLFNHLQGNSTASLILKPSRPGSVQFFVISASINYSVVVSGECDGELPTQEPRSFDVILDSLAPLLDKNQTFKLSYAGGTLRFVEVNDKFSLEPCCVEHVSDLSLGIIQRYLSFIDALTQYEEGKENLDEAERALASLRTNYKDVKILSLSGGPPSNPFDDFSVKAKDSSVDAYYRPLIAAAEAKLAALQNTLPKITVVDMSPFKRIAGIAARYNTTLAMCDDYVVVNLKSAFVLQKVPCGTRAIQGKLLQLLLRESDGRFYEYDGELIFQASGGKGRDRSDTFVFLQTYLPNTGVDLSVITKGAVHEKYRLNLKGMLPVISAVSAKFNNMVFDMGASSLILSNEKGEHLVHPFEVEDAKTIELNKIMRGETADKVVMSIVEIPQLIQKILPLMRDDFVVYVKERKIVLQSGTLYVVFSK